MVVRRQEHKRFLEECHKDLYLALSVFSLTYTHQYILHMYADNIFDNGTNRAKEYILGALKVLETRSKRVVLSKVQLYICRCKIFEDAIEGRFDC